MADLMKESLSQFENIIDSMKRLNEFSVGIMNKMITDSLKPWTIQPCCGKSSYAEDPHRVPNDARIICPPRDNCPPRCLQTIIRHAKPGETIIVPFKIRNNSNIAKTYLLGVREILNPEGTAVVQPTVDKVKIEVQPGMAVAAEMKIELNDKFKSGSVYETDIVIRENRHNQNICFKLCIDADTDIPEAIPYDEKEIDTHFHRWYYHYYCGDEKRPNTLVINPEN
jgi:hypothetical protein